MITKFGGKTSIVCDICDYDEATYLTPDHHLCSKCYDRYPIGSDEFFEALDWSERTLG
ncbi:MULTISPECIES: hypothetical protein [Nocardia]|uniref:hypothetical protein n=1 Tax=Nocardia TaxID=1817 RepID=UPI000B2BCB7E|nr:MULTISPECIES: hypothetical protein [Nocardia]